MRWSVGAKIGAGFALAIVIVIIGSFIRQHTINVMLENNASVNHSYKILNSLEHFLSTVTDIETGQRGFIITGDEQYLTHYFKGIKNTNEQIEQLRVLTQDNPNQQPKINEMKEILKSKLEELDKTISLRKTKGFDAALEVIRTDKGKQLMESMRNIVKEVETEANNKLLYRQLQTDKSVSRQDTFDLFANITTILALIIIAISITRNIVIPLRQISDISQKIA